MTRSCQLTLPLSLSLAVVAVAPSIAAAEPPDPTVAITVSPLHAIIPMGEITVEARLAPRIGVALTAGVGAVRDEATDHDIRVLEAGGSARYYAFGSFRTGLYLGGEALYLHADLDPGDTASIQAAGLGLGAFVGGKWTHRSGLTFGAALGASVFVARGEAENGASAERRDVGPLLNLDVGYSF